VKTNSKLAGIEALREEVRWLYVRPDGPKLLHTAVSTVQGILQQSDKEEKVELDGAVINIMSKGACIPLRRVLDRMRSLIDG
jgi:ubiquitin-conjugating enzyme E2 O